MTTHVNPERVEVGQMWIFGVEAGGMCASSLGSVQTLLEYCHEYEAKRGGLTRPKHPAAEHDGAMRVYERTRGVR